MRKLILGRARTEVRLILGRIDAPLEAVAPGRFVEVDARVVTGGDEVGSEPSARVASVANFKSPLQCTHGIGVRPAAYSRTKLAITVLGELPLEIEDVVRNVDARGHAPGVVQVVNRAAAAEAHGRVGLALVVQLHREADHVVPLVEPAAPPRPTSPRLPTLRQRCAYVRPSAPRAPRQAAELRRRSTAVWRRQSPLRHRYFPRQG